MNFISQTLSNLTSGGKLYIFFQIIYLTGALFFTYVQFQILNALRNNSISNIISSTSFKDYRIEYILDEEKGVVLVVASSCEKAIAHIKSIYPEAKAITCLEGDIDEVD